jgi:hypothetical protein
LDFCPLFAPGFALIFTPPFRLVSAPEICCFIELFGNRRRFCRILEIQPPSALYSMPALLKYDVEPLVSGATLSIHLAVDFLFGAAY